MDNIQKVKIKNELKVILTGVLGMLVMAIALYLFTSITNFYYSLMYFLVGYVIGGSIKTINGPSKRNGIYSAVFSSFGIILANGLITSGLNIMDIPKVGILNFLNYSFTAMTAFGAVEFIFIALSIFFAYKMGSRYTNYDF